MDILQQEVRGIALTTLSGATLVASSPAGNGTTVVTPVDQHAPVYNSTTVPLNRKDSRNMEQALRNNSNNHVVHHNNNNNNNNNSNHYQSHNDIEAHHVRPFQNLPPCEPVDIQFKDVSYCVSMGFRKGAFECVVLSLRN